MWAQYLDLIPFSSFVKVRLGNRFPTLPHHLNFPSTAAVDTNNGPRVQPAALSSRFRPSIKTVDRRLILRHFSTRHLNRPQRLHELNAALA